MPSTGQSPASFSNTLSSTLQVLRRYLSNRLGTRETHAVRLCDSPCYPLQAQLIPEELPRSRRIFSSWGLATASTAHFPLYHLLFERRADTEPCHSLNVSRPPDTSASISPLTSHVSPDFLSPHDPHRVSLTFASMPIADHRKFFAPFATLHTICHHSHRVHINQLRCMIDVCLNALHLVTYCTFDTSCTYSHRFP